MTQQLINIGTTINDRSGDPLRTAFDKINQNFAEVYTAMGLNEATELGNFVFTGNQLTNINGGNINNSDAEHGATAYISIPTNGSGSTQLLNYYGGTRIMTSATGVNELKTWNFDPSGTLILADKLPITFTAVFDNAHAVGEMRGLVGTPWETTVSFVRFNNDTETNIANIFPILDNPNYISGDTFLFTDQDHGITGYELTITLNDVLLPGGAGWTANFTATPPPSISSAIQFADGTIQKTAYPGPSLTNALINGNRSLTLDDYGVVNMPISQFNTAQLFAPYNETLMLGNSSHYIQVRGTDGALVFSDYSVQTSAYTGSGDGITYSSILDAYSDNYTVTDQQLVIVYNNGVPNRTITLPANPVYGQTITIKKSAAFTSWGVTVDGNGQNIDDGLTVYFNNPYGYITVTYNTTYSCRDQWFIVGGNYASV